MYYAALNIVDEKLANTVTFEPSTLTIRPLIKKTTNYNRHNRSLKCFHPLDLREKKEFEIPLHMLIESTTLAAHRGDCMFELSDEKEKNAFKIHELDHL